MISIADSFSPEEKLLRAIYGPVPIKKTAWVPSDFKAVEYGYVERDELTAAYKRLRLYPHCTKEIAHIVAMEWESFGGADAKRRGIDRKTWLWKRSRFLAGHK